MNNIIYFSSAWDKVHFFRFQWTFLNDRDIRFGLSETFSTGAQEWHVVSLLGDVISPNTAVHYVSMTSDLRVLSTEKHCPVRRQHTVYTNTSYSARGKYLVRHRTSREVSLRHNRGWGTWSVSPQYRDLRTRGIDISTVPGIVWTARDASSSTQFAQSSLGRSVFWTPSIRGVDTGGIRGSEPPRHK